MVEWDIYDTESTVIDFLPSMKTDISLHNGDKTLIIDTKFYGSMTQTQFGKATIHSGNMYQIFTYVKNKDCDNRFLLMLRIRIVIIQVMFQAFCCTQKRKRKQFLNLMLL